MPLNRIQAIAITAYLTGQSGATPDFDQRQFLWNRRSGPPIPCHISVSFAPDITAYLASGQTAIPKVAADFHWLTQLSTWRSSLALRPSSPKLSLNSSSFQAPYLRTNRRIYVPLSPATYPVRLESPARRCLLLVTDPEPRRPRPLPDFANHGIDFERLDDTAHSSQQPQHKARRSPFACRSRLSFYFHLILQPHWSAQIHSIGEFSLLAGRFLILFVASSISLLSIASCRLTSPGTSCPPVHIPAHRLSTLAPLATLAYPTQIPLFFIHH